VIEVKVFRRDVRNDGKAHHPDHIDDVNGHNAQGDKPELVRLVAGIGYDENRKKRKKRDGIAVGADPDPVRAVYADHLDIPVLQHHKGLVANGAENKVGRLDDKADELLIVERVALKNELVNEIKQEIKRPGRNDKSNERV